MNTSDKLYVTNIWRYQSGSIIQVNLLARIIKIDQAINNKFYAVFNINMIAVHAVLTCLSAEFGIKHDEHNLLSIACFGDG